MMDMEEMMNQMSDQPGAAPSEGMPAAKMKIDPASESELKMHWDAIEAICEKSGMDPLQAVTEIDQQEDQGEQASNEEPEMEASEEMPMEQESSGEEMEAPEEEEAPEAAPAMDPAKDKKKLLIIAALKAKNARG